MLSSYRTIDQVLALLASCLVLALSYIVHVRRYRSKIGESLNRVRYVYELDTGRHIGILTPNNTLLRVVMISRASVTIFVELPLCLWTITSVFSYFGLKNPPHTLTLRTFTIIFLSVLSAGLLLFFIYLFYTVFTLSIFGYLYLRRSGFNESILQSSLKIGLYFAASIFTPRFIRYLYRNLLLRKRTTHRQLKGFYNKNLANILSSYAWIAWSISLISLGDPGEGGDILSMVFFPFPMLLCLCWFMDRNIFKELKRFEVKS